VPDERLAVRRPGELIPHSPTIRKPSANLWHALRTALGPPPGVTVFARTGTPAASSAVVAVGALVSAFELAQLLYP